METEFSKLSFDQIRYSMVWEGADSLQKALQPTAGDHLLVICSAGCNVLNALLLPCQSVTAIDLNPLQIKLLELKGFVIARFPYEVYGGLMGFDGTAGMQQACKLLLPALSPADQAFWHPIFAANPRGLLLAGRLETYINGFEQELSPEQQQLMHHLFAAQALPTQQQAFEKLLRTDFKTRFINYFNRQQLSKGRDPRLFKYADDPGGESFFNRLERYLQQHLLANSFISHFFFFGPANIPMALRPPAYQAQNYAALQAAWPKLRTQLGEAVDFLFSPAGQHINKASLSNIFEYTSSQIFEQTVGALVSQRPQPLRFVYWNLLNDQGGALRQHPAYLAQMSAELSRQEDCFYFDSLHLFDSRGQQP